MRRIRETGDVVRLKPQQQEALAYRGDLGLMAGVDRGDLFQLLTARRAERRELLRSLELLVIGVQHGLHREIFHLRLGQLHAEDHRQRLTARDGRAQLDRHLTHDAPHERVHLRVAVGVGHDRPRNRERGARRHASSRRRIDPGPLDRFGREHDLDALVTLRGFSTGLHRLRPC